MNSMIIRQGSNVLRRPGSEAAMMMMMKQQRREIRVRVLNGNLDQAVRLLQRKMQSSGIERLIKDEPRHHIKNSEKRVLAGKALEARIRSQEIARKMKTILIHKVRGL